MAVGEKFQDLLRVVADGSQFDSLFFESRGRVLQLDQLPFAEWSPVGGTEKENDGSVRSFQRGESLRLAELVAQ